MCRSAYDRKSGLLPAEIVDDSSSVLFTDALPEDVRFIVPKDAEELQKVTICGTEYNPVLYLILDLLPDMNSLKIGAI